MLTEWGERVLYLLQILERDGAIESGRKTGKRKEFEKREGGVYKRNMEISERPEKHGQVFF